MTSSAITASTTFAQNLVGQTIPDGWKIVSQLPKPKSPGAEDATGSCFSLGYIAERSGKKAFVKVVDLQSALFFHSGNLMERLGRITADYTFECTILGICNKARLDRVVQVLGMGDLQPNLPGAVAVPYILFELADGDVRRVVAKSDKVDNAWRLRILHDVAVGISQLHGQQIAHQDLKPSNVLIFEGGKKSTKIGDLGRASRRGMDAGHDGEAIAGAVRYAPPEQVYGIIPKNWEDRREGCDLYHLGSLLTFLFAGITPTDHYIKNLPDDLRPLYWGGKSTATYETALPILLSEFTRFVDEIGKDFPEWGRNEMQSIVLNACHPDYAKRGDPAARGKAGRPLGMETFVSRFDRLAKRALVETTR